MRWEELTSAEFPEAIRKSKGVCVFAIGSVEVHGPHGPLGSDYIQAHHIACLAAEKEPAVVFPPFYFGQVNEGRYLPGTITIKPALLVELIQSVFDEISRNGFKKIIIYNGHGGNIYLLRFLSQCTLWEEKPYYVYDAGCIPLTPERLEQVKKICKSGGIGHAGEGETSLMFGIYPHLVKTDKFPKKPAPSLNRLKHLPPLFTGVYWYANYPDYYTDDPRDSSIEKGQKLIPLFVDTLAEYIAAVKADKVVPALTKEFYQRVKKVSKIREEISKKVKK